MLSNSGLPVSSGPRACDDGALDGFRFWLRYEADEDATATVDMVVLVVARLLDEALALARTECPRPCVTLLVGRGPSILKEATRRGLTEGRALVL